MSFQHPKDLILEARETVSSASYSPKKLALLHTGITAAASVVVALLTYLLGTGIGETGGLGGISSRAALETAQSILELAVSMLSPFWAMGFVAAALQMARRNDATPSTLLQGFRRWAAVLRLLILQAVMYFGAIIISVQVGSFLYTITPFSNQLNELVSQRVAAGTTDTEAMRELLMGLDSQVLMQIFWSMAPFLFLPALIVMVLLSYRLRMAQFLLMERPEFGAVFAVVTSFRLTKKNCLRLFMLDLRFWWFYVLDMVVLVLCYGDLILPLMGVELGMNGVLASFLFYALALVCQIVLYMWQKPQIITSYALFYDDRLPRQEEAEADPESETQV